jgi:hypothetical protein
MRRLQHHRRRRTRALAPATLLVVATIGLAGCLVPVAKAPDGSPANGRGYPASISDDGRFIAFPSDASNLVPGDTNGFQDLFVFDRRRDQIERIHVSSSGEQANGPSLTRQRISGNGRYVLFLSTATNLVPGDTNGVEDAFVRDLKRDTTERVTVGTRGEQITSLGVRGGMLSDNGRYIVFAATGLDPADPWLSHVYVRDRWRGTTRVLPGPELPPDAQLGTLSGDGNILVYLVPSPNLDGDVPVIRDLRTGQDDRLLAEMPFIWEYSIDLDDAGRMFTWGGRAADGVYTAVLADRRTREIETLATTTGGHIVPTLSSDGRFHTTFTPAGSADGLSAMAWVVDRRTGDRQKVGVGYWTDISDDGRAITLETHDQRGPFLWTAPD